MEDEFEVRLDGTLDESIWEEVPKYDNILVSDPDTLVTLRCQTHMRFFLIPLRACTLASTSSNRRIRWSGDYLAETLI